MICSERVLKTFEFHLFGARAIARCQRQIFGHFWLQRKNCRWHPPEGLPVKSMALEHRLQYEKRRVRLWQECHRLVWFRNVVTQTCQVLVRELD